ncbi:MAG: electron transfer flavoprotein subunit alpha/FixB family protein [Proteobacteria bacterium]|nr:electron transfer flavoprotein subunit alpha/FixB family protein [Pseudomonadota bacterium]
MHAEIVVISDSLYIAEHDFPDMRVVIQDDIISTLMHPAHACLKLSELFIEYSICAVLAPHNTRWIRILSMLSATAHMPFIAGMNTRCLPECARTICAGCVTEKLQTPEVPFVATLMLDCPRETSSAWPIEGHPFSIDELVCEDKLIFYPVPMVSFEPFITDTVNLDTARMVFAGGRGLGSKENFERLAQCAEKYGAGLAASRLAVDLGWCRNDLQVGQTGRTIAPDIYITFGISGAIQHLAGIRNAKTIIAINNDKDAPIFHYANYGVVADVNRVLDRIL